jgi:hypothetical protein
VLSGLHNCLADSCQVEAPLESTNSLIVHTLAAEVPGSQHPV